MAGLRANAVRDLTKPGRYGDGGGLYLNVSLAGTKSWVMRAARNGKRGAWGLGSYPATSLQEARAKTELCRAMIAEGRDPWDKAERQRMGRAEALARPPTFAEAARTLHGKKVQGGEISSAKHARNWLQVLERHAFPLFGGTPVNEIHQREVKDFLERLGFELPETARRVRFRMREIFDDCIESEYITVNAAGDGIRASVKRWSRNRKVTHFKALPYQDVPGIMDKILYSQGMRETRLALAFQVLTAARSGEVRGATWDEIDEAAKVWRIPAERMKSDRPHVVPLSIEALVLLHDAREAASKRLKRHPHYNPNGLIFAHPSGRPLSENALSLRTRKDGLGCTPHGFRSSFKGWATAQGKWQWEAIELSLAHKVGNSVAQAYFRDDLLEQRRPIMDEWSQYVWPVRPF